MWNPDTAGVTLEKPKPRMFSVNLNYFEDAIGWVRRYLAQYGYAVSIARLDPYVEVWFFYEDDTLVLILGNSDVERIAEGLHRGAVPKPVEGLWKFDREPKNKNGRIIS